jgi:hypothetical protein
MSAMAESVEPLLRFWEAMRWMQMQKEEPVPVFSHTVGYGRRGVVKGRWRERD